jgi:hypothetical protein
MNSISAYPGRLILLLSILAAAAILVSGCAQLGLGGQGKKELTFSTLDKIPSATVGRPYEYSFCRPSSSGRGATCGGFLGATDDPSGGNPPYSFSYGMKAGLKPPGLALELNGRLSGTPILAGTYSFEVCVKDMDGTEICKVVTMTVYPAETPINETKDGTKNVTTTTTTPDIKITSVECNIYGIHSTAHGDDGTMRITASGTASGPVDSNIALDYTTSPHTAPGAKVDCGAWTETCCITNCYRAKGDPETTNWIVTGPEGSGLVASLREYWPSITFEVYIDSWATGQQVKKYDSQNVPCG